MNTYPVRLALAAIVAAVPTVSAVSAVTASTSTTTAAEYCTYVGSAYLGNKKLNDPGVYCIPGP